MKLLDECLMDILEYTTMFKISIEEAKNLILALFNKEHDKTRAKIIDDLIDTLKELK